ncbi:condensin complex subunit 3-like [Limulus polyphemus]|uniref:Condensin complex subunit 3-like n=1 Tax=Limulus polyphemus TaxID=6850 RepID=A0ABM1TDK1_LIMPO|nr:condensin complex subunit 3-like [Limulus polyphemus]
MWRESWQTPQHGEEEEVSHKNPLDIDGMPKKKSSLDEFSPEFFRYLRYSMVVSERHPCVERTLEFVSKFVVSLGTKDKKDVQLEETNVIKNDDDTEELENPFLLKVFEFLLKCSEVCNVHFRTNCYKNEIQKPTLESECHWAELLTCRTAC